jgi:hypothetical protein
LDTALDEPKAYDPRALSAPVQPSTDAHEQPSRTDTARGGSRGASRGGAPARERARAAARGHHARHGQLPTVTELSEAAQVARGTAGAVLKELRHERAQLHVVHGPTDTRTDQ